MPAYESNATLADIAQRIRDAKRIMVTTHTKPDGDAMGSVVALSRALEPMGKQVGIYLAGPLENGLKVIAGATAYHFTDATPPRDEWDLILVVDTGSWSQLESVESFLRDKQKRIVGIDHHRFGNDVAGMRYIEPQAAATTQILVELLDELDAPLTGEHEGVAEALFLGLATDTGWFRFDNADAKTFAVAARLLEAGVDKSRLYQIVEETFRPQRMALLSRALASVEYVCGNAVAMMFLKEEDFDQTGGSMEDLTGIVNEPMGVAAVRATMLFTQVKPGQTKISLRSKPPIDDEQTDFDVNEVAQQVGGGGHRRAAGARVEMNIDEARDAIVAALGTCGYC